MLLSRSSAHLMHLSSCGKQRWPQAASLAASIKVYSSSLQGASMPAASTCTVSKSTYPQLRMLVRSSYKQGCLQLTLVPQVTNAIRVHPRQESKANSASPMSSQLKLDMNEMITPLVRLSALTLGICVWSATVDSTSSRLKTHGF